MIVNDHSIGAHFTYQKLGLCFPRLYRTISKFENRYCKSIILQPECILICERCRTMADIGHRDRLQHHRPQDWRCHGNRQVVCDRGLDALLRLGRGIGDNTTEGNCGHRLKKKGHWQKNTHSYQSASELTSGLTAPKRFIIGA